MTYFQVKTENDQKVINNRSLIKNELYTQRELDKLSINENLCQKIETSSRNTYFSFGARFVNHNGESLVTKLK